MTNAPLHEAIDTRSSSRSTPSPPGSPAALLCAWGPVFFPLDWAASRTAAGSWSASSARFSSGAGCIAWPHAPSRTRTLGGRCRVVGDRTPSGAGHDGHRASSAVRRTRGPVRGLALAGWLYRDVFWQLRRRPTASPWRTLPVHTPLFGDPRELRSGELRSTYEEQIRAAAATGGAEPARARPPRLDETADLRHPDVGGDGADALRRDPSGASGGPGTGAGVRARGDGRDGSDARPVAGRARSRTPASSRR